LSRGRRLEVSGFGALGAGGLTLVSGSRWAGLVLGLIYILYGCFLQWRAERKQKKAGPGATEVWLNGQRLYTQREQVGGSKTEGAE
jgi:hypothetical protein